jgi:hypothetical protein
MLVTHGQDHTEGAAGVAAAMRPRHRRHADRHTASAEAAIGRGLQVLQRQVARVSAERFAAEPLATCEGRLVVERCDIVIGCSTNSKAVVTVTTTGSDEGH